MNSNDYLGIQDSQPQTQTDCLPFSPVAEQALLGAVFQNQDILKPVAEVVSFESFFDNEHRKIYSTMLSLQRQGITPNEVNVCMALKPDVQWDYVASLQMICPHWLNWRDYAEAVVREHKKRRSVALMRSSLDAVTAGEMIDAAGVMMELEELQATALADESPADGNPKLVIETMEKLQEEYEGTKSAGVKTGFPDLDEATGGLMNGEMTILAARPSLGKSSLAFNIVENAAIKNGLSVGLISMEMGRHSVIKRMIASQSRVNLRRVRNQQLGEDDFMKLKAGQKAIAGASIWIDDTPAMKVSRLRSTTRWMVEKQAIKLLVVDYLQLMSGDNPNRTDNREREVAELSGALKSISNEYQIPVLVLAQLNRNIEYGKGRYPKLSDLRESGQIEADADGVWFLFTDEQTQRSEEENPAPSIPVKLLIGKQRNGPRDIIVNLTFLKEFTRFESAAKISEDDKPNNRHKGRGMPNEDEV